MQYIYILFKGRQDVKKKKTLNIYGERERESFDII